MSYLVFIKQVPDTAERLCLSEKGELDLSSVKWVLSPYDEFALEEALRRGEKDSKEVEVISLGPSRVQTSLRSALALGAARGHHIETDQKLDALSAAKVCHEILKEKLLNTEAVFCGKQSSDFGSGAFGPALSGFLERPFVSSVVKIEKIDEKTWEVHRSLEGGGSEVSEIKGSVVFCVTKGINTPRLASLPAIMRSKNKVIEKYQIEKKTSSFSLSKLFFPKPRSPVQMIEGSPVEQAKKLIQILKEKENVL